MSYHKKKHVSLKSKMIRREPKPWSVQKFTPCQAFPPLQCALHSDCTCPCQRGHSPMPPHHSQCGSLTPLTDGKQWTGRTEAQRKTECVTCGKSEKFNWVSR